MKETLSGYLRKQGYDTPSDLTYSHIDEWLEWYQNDVENFHKYKVYTGVNIRQEERYRLGMAKTVSEDWANLLMNERVDVRCEDELQNDVLQEALQRNNFRIRANQLVEIAFALGTGAITVYANADGLAEVDYIRADCICPISWDNGDIIECAFGSERRYNGKQALFVSIHRKGREEDGEDPDVYYIENHVVNEDTGNEMPLPDNVADLIGTGSTEPMFSIITPNVFNNIDIESPLGISVYANAIWELKGCDLVYDSYMNEFVLGRKRVLVGQRAVARMMENDGVTVPAFDPNDTVFVTYTDNAAEDQTPIKEIDMQLRANEHELAIQRALDLLSMKCGLGPGYYRFDNGVMKTATEVVSSNSKLYRNLCKHELIPDFALKRVARNILFVEMGIEDPDITIDFDDSVIEDTDKERTTDRQDVAMGAMQLWEYRKKYYGGTDEEAKEAIFVPAEVIE